MFDTYVYFPIFDFIFDKLIGYRKDSYYTLAHPDVYIKAAKFSYKSVTLCRNYTAISTIPCQNSRNIS